MRGPSKRFARLKVRRARRVVKDNPYARLCVWAEKALDGAEKRAKDALSGTKRSLLRSVGDVAAYHVDGDATRAKHPDFDRSANHETHSYVPSKEIWIDESLTDDEADVALLRELVARAWMIDGTDEDAAVAKADGVASYFTDDANGIEDAIESAASGDLIEKPEDEEEPETDAVVASEGEDPASLIAPLVIEIYGSWNAKRKDPKYKWPSSVPEWAQPQGTENSFLFAKRAAEEIRKMPQARRAYAEFDDPIEWEDWIIGVMRFGGVDGAIA
jgi:hypothetical protein